MGSEMCIRDSKEMVQEKLQTMEGFQEEQQLSERLIDYIEEHLEEELSLDRMVAEFFVSKYHIAHFLRIILECQFISMCRKRDWRHAERQSGIT